MDTVCLALVFFSAFASVWGCNVPPQFWCDNLDIARECQVVSQCKQFAWNSTADSKVQLTLYYESLCPDCKLFFQNQLAPTYSKVADIMDLQLVPYGNAFEQFVDGKWKFSCQHGEDECYGNLLETCYLDITKGSMKAAFPLISCMEISPLLPKDSVKKCGSALGVDVDAVVACAGSDRGNSLEHQMAARTDKLSPPHKYVPWVTVNGVHTEAIQNQAQTNLLKLICDTYQGKKPAACSMQLKPVRSPKFSVDVL